MAKYDFRMPRLYVDCTLAPEAPIDLDQKQAHYLRNVLRMRAGDTLLVFNGRDGEWRAAIGDVAKKTVQLAAVECVRSQTAPYNLHYLFAPLKQARLDYMVQKAVEMGAGVLQPVVTEFTQVRHLKSARMAANAIEAAEQCGILSLPQIRDPMPLDMCLGQWPDQNPERHIVFCDEDAGVGPVDQLAGLGGRKLAILIGPEGGFSDAERARLLALDFVTAISLGPRILRADTAAVAALAVLQAVCGDWRPAVGAG